MLHPLHKIEGDKYKIENQRGRRRKKNEISIVKCSRKQSGALLWKTGYEGGENIRQSHIYTHIELKRRPGSAAEQSVSLYSTNMANRRNQYRCIQLVVRAAEKKRRNNIVKGLLTGRPRFVPCPFVLAHEIRSLDTVHNEQSTCVSVCVELFASFRVSFSFQSTNTTKSRPPIFSIEFPSFFSPFPPLRLLSSAPQKNSEK